MTAQDLVETLRRAGIELVVCGDRLRVEAPRGAVTPEVLAQLQEHKAMVIAELARRACWPSESIVAQRNFGVPEARLYPFLSRRVETPAGPGQLLQVFSERVAIRLDTQDSEITYFLPVEVWPPGASEASMVEESIENWQAPFH